MKNKICKLYDVPRASIIKILGANPKTPIASPEILKDQYLVFDHIDGMYSLCYDINNQIVHLAAFEEVEIIKDFEIIRKLIRRGGRGKNGDLPLKWVPICEMSDSWINAIIPYNREHNIKDSIFSNYINQELEYRKKHNIVISD